MYTWHKKYYFVISKKNSMINLVKWFYLYKSLSWMIFLIQKCKLNDFIDTKQSSMTLLDKFSKLSDLLRY